MIKKISLFFMLTAIFSVSLYAVEILTSSKKKKEITEEDLLLENKAPTNLQIEKKEIEKPLSFYPEEKIVFLYIPKEIKAKSIDKKEDLSKVLNSKIFKNKISNLKVEFHKNKPSVRGNMKKKTLKLFGIFSMKKEELISVSIHELAHYIDIYFFDLENKNDISYSFYNISWENYKIIKKGSTIKDFVSGYAMSNKYEDFAESFTYFILHNNDFLEKSKKSKALQEKYNFLKKELFEKSYFISEDFSQQEPKSYYWDITKIDFSLKNFLQYLEKQI